MLTSVLYDIFWLKHHIIEFLKTKKEKKSILPFIAEFIILFLFQLTVKS